MEKLYIMLNSVFVLVCSVNLAVSDDLPGHMKPLGSHLPPLEIETLDSPPDPLTFYSYVKQNLPVKLKGLLKDNEVLKNWENDDYLKQQFGRVHVGVEVAKKENRSKYSTAMEFSEFLDRYETEDIYMVSDMPVEMTNEWPLPPFLLCGGYTENIAFVYIWFSSGGTKSVLHTDSFENFHCVVSGTKHFVLIERKYSKQIGPEHESQGYYNLDVEAVDMDKYPGLATIPWYKVVIEPGDCLYLPYEWIHHVNSQQRNMGVNIWWIPFRFDEKQCSQQPPNQKFGFVGDFQISPQLQLKAFFLKSAKEDGMIKASDILETFSKHQGDGVADLDMIVKVMEILVPGSNGLIHKDDLSGDKVPLNKYNEAMEFVMQHMDPPPSEENWEGGGEGHPHVMDEL